VKPNDGLCHLNNDGGYTHSTTQDYPSVSQINQKVKESSGIFSLFSLLYLVILVTLTPSLIFTVNLIFAVTKEQYHIYDQLNKHVEGASCGVLSNDSSNVVELVQEQYNVTKVNMLLVESDLSGMKMFLS
jgi:protocadherin alpha